MYLHEVALVAPTLPFYYYHIPAVTGVNGECRQCSRGFNCLYWCHAEREMVVFVSVLASDLLEGIEELIPSFRGVKFSGSDLMDCGQCVSYSQPQWSVLYGVDEVGPSLLCYGCLYCKTIFCDSNLTCKTRLELIFHFSTATASRSGYGSTRSSWQVSVSSWICIISLLSFSLLDSIYLHVNYYLFLCRQYI